RLSRLAADRLGDLDADTRRWKPLADRLDPALTRDPYWAGRPGAHPTPPPPAGFSGPAPGASPGTLRPRWRRRAPLRGGARESRGNPHCGLRHWSFTDRLQAGTVPDVQRVYFWFSKPALGGLVCGNLVR
uniref:hypothetical protein n=1 Tax=Nocardia abscessus TaxID=120957 RepID=UPI002453CA6A